MKRIVALFTVFLGLFYYFSPKEEEVSHVDILKVKMSATRREPSLAMTKPALKQLPETLPVSESNVSEKISEESHVAELPEEDYEDEDQDVSDDDIPWDEIKTGWKNHLRDLLVELDPENGEEIFNAYQSENSSFESEMDNITRNPGGDMDALIGQLESRHEDKLKEILGRHYQEVTDQHQQYNSSIQYLNRSPKYQVGVSL